MSCKNSEGQTPKDIIEELLAKDKFKKAVVISGLAGILLIFASGFFKSDNKPEVKTGAKVSSEQYSEKLEQSLENIVSGIKGAGKAKVLVTLENTTETVYATEEKKNKEACEDKTNGETTRKKESDDCEKKYITVKDSDGTEQALAVTEIQPKIKGVIVVCPGADDPFVQQRIISAVTTALDVTSKRVCVTKSD